MGQLPQIRSKNQAGAGQMPKRLDIGPAGARAEIWYIPSYEAVIIIDHWSSVIIDVDW